MEPLRIAPFDSDINLFQVDNVPLTFFSDFGNDISDDLLVFLFVDGASRVHHVFGWRKISQSLRKDLELELA